MKTNKECEKCGNKSELDPCPTCGSKRHKELIEFENE